MPSTADDAALWREKAREALAQAERMTDPQTCTALLKIAEGYEHLVRIGKRAAAVAKVKPPR
jgi:hypothetical protein